MHIEQLREIMKASLDSYGCGYFGIDELEEYAEEHRIDCGFTLIEEDDWTQGHKCQYSSLIVKDEEDNYFQINNLRSGCPFTDWEYGEPSVVRVEPKTETIVRVVWKEIREPN